jgi:hypothetical protein
MPVQIQLPYTPALDEFALRDMLKSAFDERCRVRTEALRRIPSSKRYRIRWVVVVRRQGEPTVFARVIHCRPKGLTTIEVWTGASPDSMPVGGIRRWLSARGAMQDVVDVIVDRAWEYS